MGAIDLVESRSGLTAARLREVLHYCPETGKWTWLRSLSWRKPEGSEAGDPTSHGYIRIGIDGMRYRAHRLAWLYMTGEWPTDRVDHRDTDPANNRWHNLRIATNAQNGANAKISRRNTSGVKGVHWASREAKWVATLCVRGRTVCLGYYDDLADAAEAYRLGAAEHFGEFARSA